MPVHHPSELRATLDQERAIAAIDVGRLRAIWSPVARPPCRFFWRARSNAAQIVNGYLGEMVTSYIADENGARAPFSSTPHVVARNWFNPNLTFRWFTLPGLIPIIAQLIGLIVDALSVARERDLARSTSCSWRLCGRTRFCSARCFLRSRSYSSTSRSTSSSPCSVPRAARGGSVLLLTAARFSSSRRSLASGSSSLALRDAAAGDPRRVSVPCPGNAASGFATPIESTPSWLQP